MKYYALGGAVLSLLAAPVLAADLPVKAPPLSAPGFTWTGLYIGINGGGAFSANDRGNVVRETFAGAPFIAGTWPGSGVFGSRDADGGFIGGQIGYNWQVTNWVLGVEADFQGSDVRGSSGATLPYIVAPNTITATVSERLRSFGTLRGRLGWAFGNFLVYGTGGFAAGRTTTNLVMTDTLGFSAANATKNTQAGYAAGAGGEYAVTHNWTVKLEYQYLDFGRRSVTATEFAGGAATAFAVSTTSRLDYHTVRGGINYKF